MYVIRHGQSVRNVSMKGPYDCDLTERGMEQARLTGDWLQNKGIKFLYCSPTIRTIKTALFIGKALELKPKAWAPIVERGYLFKEPGLTGNELRRLYPDVHIDEGFAADKGWAEAIVDESWPELLARAHRVRDEILKAHPIDSPPVAMVTHAHFARYLVGALLGLASADDWNGVIEHYNCGVTCIEFREKTTVLHYANAHFHLGDVGNFDSLAV